MAVPQSWWRSILIGALIAACATHHAQTAPMETTQQGLSAREQLERLNGLIGEWRGIGQPRRGSTQGAWKQTSRIVWDFTEASPAIVYEVSEGQLTRSIRFTWDGEKHRYMAVFIAPDDKTVQCHGNWDDGKLVLLSEPDVDQRRIRLTVTPLNDKRTLVLHEIATGPTGGFVRVAEVGYTREGTRLALPGNVGRECVVTGGAGTMEVTYQGETYYVCCTGCLQAFNDDPAGIIADFKARLKKRLESR